MRTSTTVKRTEEIKLRMRDVFASSTQFKMPFVTIAGRLQDVIYEGPEIPQWARNYLRGYSDAMIDSLWKHAEFRYQMADGRWVNAFSLTYDNACRTPAKCDHTGHYVAHNHDTVPSGYFWIGSDRPFSLGPNADGPVTENAGK